MPNTAILLMGLLLVICCHFAVAAQAGSPVGESAIYKKIDGQELMVWVVKPQDWKQADRRPGIVFFHGGGFVGGAPSQFNEQAQYLAWRGMVCIQVEYRLLEKNGAEPPTICCQDAKSAMRWVRSHAGQLGIDPNRIAASGGSAGGHLAAFVSMVPGTDDPADDRSISPAGNALILFNPVLDNGPGQWGANRVGGRFAEYSPAHNVRPDAPPTIVFLGTNDALVPVETIAAFQQKMKKAGVRCEALFYKEQGHGFFNNDPYRTATLIEADKFLASLGWLSGAPMLKSAEIEPAFSPRSDQETK